MKSQDYLEKNIKELLLRLVIFETFDQSVEEIWPDQPKDNHDDKHDYNDKDKDMTI